VGAWYRQHRTDEIREVEGGGNDTHHAAVIVQGLEQDDAVTTGTSRKRQEW
jgi:hypothetical protein